MNSRDSHIETIVSDLRIVYASLNRLSVPAWLRLDLTMAQFKALVAVERNSGIAVCKLGRQLGIGESAVSLLVDQLVRRHYLERTIDPADRRRVLLSATAQATSLLQELRHGSEQSLKEWLAGLDDDDVAGLAHGLSNLTEAARAAEPPAAPHTVAEKLKT
jgi:DNA-binding MarR family transcriptional regulator